MADNYFRPINGMEKKIIESEEFRKCCEFGVARKGHAEGKTEEHIRLILEYIEQNYKEDPDYERLRLLALLHDMGKFEEADQSHAVLSEQISKKFIKDRGLLRIIRIHDFPWAFYRIFKKKKQFDKYKFIDIFKEIDWRLLVKFRYCDNCNRSQEPSIWFEEKCKELLKPLEK
ncbi:HD domain-containing protein [Candidatus Woesearchaeota archaeon]|nr:HD domain-containing protein [Candidatus Woesearchaeota archaeon]